jgi:hypothetical protein
MSAGEPPTPGQMQRWRRRTSPPENELPASPGLSALLGRTDDAAVGITGVEAFSTGFRFTLAIRLRRPRPELAHGGLFALVSAHAHPGREIPPEDRLLLGVEYADGRRASTLENMRMMGPAAEVDDTQLVLVQNGSRGGEGSVDQTYWVTPLPPDGPVTVVLAWASFGMPESRTVLDGGAIKSAAAHSNTLWPPQPPMEPPQPQPPARPSSGWFAEPPD